MTNRERVLAAIRHEPVDKVPYFVRFTSAMLAKMNEYTGERDFSATLDNAYAMVSAKLECVPDPKRPFHVYDEYGTLWDRTADKDIGVPKNVVIPTAQAILEYRPATVDEGHLKERCQTLLDQGGGRRFTALHSSSPLFERAWMLCGMENLFCYMHEEPELTHALMRKLCDREHARLEIELKYDVDCIHYTDDYGCQRGLITSPQMWREFVKPYLGELFKHIKDAGKYVELHSCGDNRMIMDELIALGLDIYNTFQPEIYTLEYPKQIAGRLAIMGGISTQRDLPSKTPGEIREIVRETKLAFNRRGLIVAPTHDIPGDVPPENVLAMLEEMENG